MPSTVSRRTLIAAIGGAGVVAAGGGFAAGALPADKSAVSPDRAPLLIGSILPLSGSLGPDAILLRNGMTMAIDEANAAGGVAGRPLHHIVVDTDVTSDDSVARGTAELVTRRVHAAVNGFVIAWRSGYDTWRPYGAPYLHSSSSEEQRAYVAAGSGLPFFQVTPTDFQYGNGLISLLDRYLKAGSFTPASRILQFVTRNVPHTAAIEAGARAGAKTSPNGWSFAPGLVLAEPVGDWSGRLQTIAAAHPQVVIINTTDPVEAAAFVVAAHRAALAAVLYYPAPSDGITTPIGDGVLTARVAGRYDDAPGAAFAAAYQRAFGHPPDGSYASCGYDSVQILLAAWGQSSPDQFPAVCGVLRRQTWRGVQGSVNLSSAGQTSSSYPAQTTDPSLGQALLFSQRTGGVDVVIDPAPYATVVGNLS